MTVTQSSVAVLVPLKSFASAKERLVDALDRTERSDLMRDLAAGVLEAAGGLARWVVCDDEEVAWFALANGAQVLWRSGGLNGSVQRAVEQLAIEGFDRVVVSHGDIARPRNFNTFTTPPSATPDAVVIGSDRHGEGSNVLSVPTNAGFTFAYGVGSFARHISEAERCGLTVVRAKEPSLQLDVDTPEDLALYRGGQ